MKDEFLKHKETLSKKGLPLGGRNSIITGGTETSFHVADNTGGEWASPGNAFVETIHDLSPVHTLT